MVQCRGQFLVKVNNVKVQTQLNEQFVFAYTHNITFPPYLWKKDFNQWQTKPFCLYSAQVYQYLYLKMSVNSVYETLWTKHQINCFT